MARSIQRPENALKRANEFIDVGKPAQALDTLSEVFRNKKLAYTWTENVLEPIMFKYLDLCVELKKSLIAKEGLFQYRNMFQSVNVGSLENVIRFYLRTAEERTEAARNQSQQAVVDIEIDDLDNLATPESILLSAVSGDDAQDRSDRTILTPWVKFLWESYCQCLELLRTNVHVETLYHDIARMAFQFCLKYNRKTEFRKLCEKLRKHLEDISKLTPQVSNVSISKPETQQLNLETRLYQLDSAMQMELWQEAYKAIEDIHGLMSMSKKPHVPKTMANYYQKLALVFWKAGNYLFHAAALFKLFQLSKDMKKNMSNEELQRMACKVLIATLSIPLPSAHPEFDRFIETDKSPLEKAQRLATLLGLPQPPTRASLLRDIVRMNVVALASKPLQNLYSWLEVEFHPLLLCENVHSVIKTLMVEESSTTLLQYIPALQDVTLVRLIRQVAQVYQTIELARMMELAKFTDAFHLERLLVDCVRHNDMQIRIDHGAKCIRFGIDLSEAQREDKPEGPTLQSMPSEQVRNQLVTMASVLHRAMATINPNKKKLERERLRAKLVQQYHESKISEHERILERHKIIEDRKEYIERKNTQREEEELRRQELIQRQLMLQEQKRLEAEREERERRRHENEIQQIKDKHLKERMLQISQTAHGQKMLKKLDEDEMKKLDADQIAAKEQEELQKERKEMQQKLKTQEKKVDYFERAKRLEEIPLLEKAFEKKQVQDKLLWEQREQERIQKLIEDRELALKCAERLKRMEDDKNAFLEELKAKRRNIYLEKLKDFETRLNEERKKRLAERRIRRKEDRRKAYIQEKKKEEAERKRLEEEKKLEEEKRKQKEEEERLEKIRKQREDELYRKEREKKDRQAEIQRIREEEVERKRLENESRTMETWRSDRGFRDRERDKDDRRDRDRDDGNEREETESWRRGKPLGIKDDISEPKKDNWRSSGVRNRERESDAGPKLTEQENWRSGSRVEQSYDRYDRGDRDRDRDRDGIGRPAFDRNRDDRGQDRRGYDKPARGRESVGISSSATWRSKSDVPERRDDRRDERREDRREDKREERRDDRREERRDDRREDRRDDRREDRRDDRREERRDDRREERRDDRREERREERRDDRREERRDDRREERRDDRREERRDDRREERRDDRREERRDDRREERRDDRREDRRDDRREDRRDDRREERRDERTMRRGGREEDRNVKRDDRSSHGDWRTSRDEPRTPVRSKETGPRDDPRSQRTGPRETPSSKEEKQSKIGRQDQDEEEWKTVSGRR